MTDLNIDDLNDTVPFFVQYLESAGCQDLSETEAQLIQGGKATVGGGQPGIDPTKFVCTNLYTFFPPGDGDCYEITPTGPRRIDPPNPGEILR
jgi:hypothetical protein